LRPNLQTQSATVPGVGPGGVDVTRTTQWSSTLTPGTGPFDFVEVRTATTNGDTSTGTVTASPGGWSRMSTSPLGRPSVATLDALGRVGTTDPPGTLLAPTQYSYDPATGGVATVLTGSGNNERRIERTYNAESELETVAIG